MVAWVNYVTGAGDISIVFKKVVGQHFMIRYEPPLTAYSSTVNLLSRIFEAPKTPSYVPEDRLIKSFY